MSDMTFVFGQVDDLTARLRKLERPCVDMLKPGIAPFDVEDAVAPAGTAPDGAGATAQAAVSATRGKMRAPLRNDIRYSKNMRRPTHGRGVRAGRLVSRSELEAGR